MVKHNFTFCARQADVTIEQYRRDPKLAARVLEDASYCYLIFRVTIPVANWGRRLSNIRCIGIKADTSPV